jgi:hypothetical protein
MISLPNLNSSCLSFANPDGPLCSFFCGIDWNQAITECPQRCPSGDSKECPGDWSCYAFTPCLGPGVNTAPTLKPTWEPTMRPVSSSPTTTLHYWNEQNKRNSSSPMGNTNIIETETEVALWTAAPTYKPTGSPTLDQCRAPPCDNPGECRSGLGFCGTGIVYCNSMSSFKPECIGGVSQLESVRITPQPTFPNKGGPPTISPTTKWDAWVQANHAGDTPAPSPSDIAGLGVNSTGNVTEEWSGFKATPQPSKKPVTDPFSWVSGGAFDGETYSSDSPWWNQASASDTTSIRGTTLLFFVCVFFAITF